MLNGVEGWSDFIVDGGDFIDLAFNNGKVQVAISDIVFHFLAEVPEMISAKIIGAGFKGMGRSPNEVGVLLGKAIF